MSRVPLRRLALSIVVCCLLSSTSAIAAALRGGSIHLTILPPPNGVIGSSATTVAVGMQPSAIAVDPAAHAAFVANQGSNTVSIIDTTSKRVTAMVAVGRYPSAVAVDPAMRRVYIANQGADSVSILDEASGQTISTTPLAFAPNTLAVDAGNHAVYIGGAISFYADPFGRVAMVDGTTGKVTTTLPIGGTNERSALQEVDGIALDSGFHAVYLATHGKYQGDVLLWNTLTNQQTVIAALSGESAIAVDTSTHRLVLASVGGTLTFLDPSGTGTYHSSEAKVRVGGFPVAVAIDSSRRFVFVTGSTAHTVSFVNELTGRLGGTIEVGSKPVAFAIDPAMHVLYVANQESGTVSIVSYTGDQSPARPSQQPLAVATPSLPQTGGGGTARCRPCSG